MKNGRLELTVPALAHSDQSGNQPIVKLVAPCELSGDFAVTIHYKLLTWPLTNGVWVGIGAGADNVARISVRVGTDNNYATYLSGTVTKVSTADMTGSLRLARVGSTVSGYYQAADGGWVKIATAAAPADPVTYAIQEWTDAGFGQRDVVAAVDSVSVTGNKVNCS